ncbi:hypothetical protein CYMTET_56383, partial [Cymbomonas tetramitiformis]
MLFLLVFLLASGGCRLTGSRVVLAPSEGALSQSRGEQFNESASASARPIHKLPDNNNSIRPRVHVRSPAWHIRGGSQDIVTPHTGGTRKLLSTASPVSSESSFGVGCNTYGQLGDGARTSRSTLAPVMSSFHISAVSAGYHHSVFLTSAGEAYTCGRNSYGQLGDGGRSSRDTPVRVLGSQAVAQVRAGYHHTLLRTAEGLVYGCGQNQRGQLGDGTPTDRLHPVLMAALENHSVVDVAAGAYNSFVRTEAGSVLGCGENSNAQLGDGSEADQLLPVQVMQGHDVVEVAGGVDHSLFRTAGGGVYACGANAHGQLGDGSRMRHVSPVEVMLGYHVAGVSAGERHSLFLISDGTVFGCGQDLYGQLGQGSSAAARTPPVQIMATHTVVEVCGGWRHSLFRTTEHVVYASGLNDYGQLGDGSTIPRFTPVQMVGAYGDAEGVAAGYGHSFSLAASGVTSTCCFHAFAPRLLPAPLVPSIPLAILPAPL